MKLKKEYEINNNKKYKEDDILDIYTRLSEFVFTEENLIKCTKYISSSKPKILKNENKGIENKGNENKGNENKGFENKGIENKGFENKVNNLQKPIKTKQFYTPYQTDSLFWCFYILKYGYFNYEMEINNQYFTVEKKEKFAFIEKLRTIKSKLKIFKIKPYTEIEDDLANKNKIEIKTFLALCVLENINVIIINNRKIMELQVTDASENEVSNVIHYNIKSKKYEIEMEVTNEKINYYRNNYLKLESLDMNLKAMGSYKLDELKELCGKLDISLEENGKKWTKTAIYEVLLQKY